ncbi:acyltransferase family protein [Acetobacter cerevisiae]|uniref:Acyltransferase n=1 Tax=Acetobacter cerevisiae TaxID=178900 RepID=A0A149V878_9PROT|nr:acyltransferase family protein [Acetobacter cerevisiae]KXV76419.1 hypothetical protein AD954_11920 [Acetobacter cerevisiae]
MSRLPLLHPNYRKDIDGLRAVAVLSVVIFHAFPDYMAGGFIGVDVFFVISGYLISTIILKNLDKDCFSFSEFYVRRINRIFPDLIVVLLFCYAFGWFALLSDEYMKLGKYIIGGAFFVSNFVLYYENGYFDDASELKPLLHLWSLGIEEQFYIFCPLVLWAAFRKKFKILGVIILFCGLSFFWNIKTVHSNPLADFYFPQTRFWELLSGGLLAWITLYKPEFASYFKGGIGGNSASAFGCLLLLYGVFSLDRTIGFPGYYALIPVLSAVLIIFSGSDAWVNRHILSHKYAVWVGLISFPLYLWHWPLLSLARIIQGEAVPPGIRAGILGVAFLLAWLTYKFIERPLRFGGNQALKASLYGVAMLCVGILGYNVYSGEGIPDRLSNFNQKNKTILSQIVSPPKLLRNKQCEQYFSQYEGGLCVLKDDKAPDILLFGDSHALQYYTGLRDALPQKNIAMLGAGWTGDALNPLLGAYQPAGAYYKIQKQIYDIIQSNNGISDIIISCYRNICVNDSFEKNMRNTLNVLLSAKKTVTFVFDVPDIPFYPKLCLDSRPFRLYSHVRKPCAFSTVDYAEESKSYKDRVYKVLADYPSVEVYDPSRFLCDDRLCYAIKAGKLLYRNGKSNSHLSDDGSAFISQSLSGLIGHQGL